MAFMQNLYGLAFGQKETPASLMREGIEIFTPTTKKGLPPK